ncbi:MAG: oxidoreductase [Kordiimonadales bacterium]|nr:MAG: oxidoreductase [Kordiimonadales bacterium]
MKISVIGGGPGGLYFALLTKKARPDFDIEVIEQNRAGDTFGFGVVFSDETLDEFFAADPESYDLIRDDFSYWQDIVVQRGTERSVIGGNGFAGCSRKILLEILHKRCKAVGVVLRFETHVDSANIEQDFAESDIIVAADGINSGIREANIEAFGSTTEMRKNYFTWLGSTRPLDAFTFFFKETKDGHFCAHTYEYEKGQSTWVVECTPETHANCGFDDMSEEDSARFLEAVFKDELEGHGFVTNRSLWRQFPRVSCANWHAGKIVLLGDAKATAHWSIGSGTKLSMECAISLSDAVIEHAGDTDAVFAAYEEARRTPVEIIQHAADVSLRWFEQMARHYNKPQYQFAFALMSRSKSITWDNLGLRDEAFLKAVEAEYYDSLRLAPNIKQTPMFTPFSLRGMTMANRVVVSPMAQYSAESGVPNDWHFVHYGARATGGAGLLITEMTCPSPDARITDACTGMWNDEQEREWKRITGFAHANGNTKICLQLGHAGRKGSTHSPETGGMDMPKDSGNWPIFSASPIPYFPDVSATPAALAHEDMARIIEEFRQAAMRANHAGFDMLELHCAHGYLLASFLSPITNNRTDDYGGDSSSRTKFPVDLFKAVRKVWPDDKPISVRLSAWDWAEGGVNWDDLRTTANAFKAAGADILDISTGQTVPHQKPVYGRMYQVPFSDFVRSEIGIPTMTVGGITLPEQVNTILAAGRADLVALARPHLNNAAFTRHAAGQYGSPQQGWPLQYQTGESQMLREAEKDREKTKATALKLRPKQRHSEA